MRPLAYNFPRDGGRIHQGLRYQFGGGIGFAVYTGYTHGNDCLRGVRVGHWYDQALLTF